MITLAERVTVLEQAQIVMEQARIVIEQRIDENDKKLFSWEIFMKGIGETLHGLVQNVSRAFNKSDVTQSRIESIANHTALQVETSLLRQDKHDKQLGSLERDNAMFKEDLSNIKSQLNSIEMLLTRIADKMGA